MSNAYKIYISKERNKLNSLETKYCIIWYIYNLITTWIINGIVEEFLIFYALFIVFKRGWGWKYENIDVNVSLILQI